MHDADFSSVRKTFCNILSRYISQSVIVRCHNRINHIVIIFIYHIINIYHINTSILTCLHDIAAASRVHWYKQQGFYTHTNHVINLSCLY